MIRSLLDINEEFRAEVADAPSPAQGIPTSDGNGDVARLVLSFKEDAKTPPRRKLSQRAALIAITVVAIILILVAVFLAVKLTPANEDIPSDGTDRTPAGGEIGADASDADAGGKDVAATGVEEGAYNSALESVENEINALRDSGETDAGAETSDAGAKDSFSQSGLLALYGGVVGSDRIEDADTDRVVDASPQRRQALIERINAYLSADAAAVAVSLPSDTEINSDTAFTSLTAPANALVNAINAGLAGSDRLPEVIDLRKNAYAIYPVRVLKKLLAIDYEDLGLYYIASGQPSEETFDAFLFAVKYRVEYLRDLHPGSGDRRAQMRRVGETYANIAQIDGTGEDHKRHAELIAACLYELAER
jgi:hypothetical protein